MCVSFKCCASGNGGGGAGGDNKAQGCEVVVNKTSNTEEGDNKAIP
jgi:hypothetical protein